MRTELLDKLSEPATDKQRRVITTLCMARRIKEPLEEYPMTLGEAGRLIRELGRLNERATNLNVN